MNMFVYIVAMFTDNINKHKVNIHKGLPLKSIGGLEDMKVKELIECLGRLDLEREIMGNSIPGIILVKSNGVTIKEIVDHEEIKYILS